MDDHSNNHSIFYEKLASPLSSDPFSDFLLDPETPHDCPAPDISLGTAAGVEREEPVPFSHQALPFKLASLFLFSSKSAVKLKSQSLVWFLRQAQREYKFPNDI